MADRKRSKKCDLLYGLLLMICLFPDESQASDVFIKIHNKLGELCYFNPAHYIHDVPKCNVTFDHGTCWPETKAGEMSTQRCSFILYEGKGTINRRCKVSLQWENMNTSSCRLLQSNKGGRGDKLQGNNNTNQTDMSSPDAVNHALYQNRVYEVFSWIAVVVMVPSLLVLFLVRSPIIDRFTIHKYLIVALLLQSMTYFIDYYGGLSHNTSQQTTCNVIWVLNQICVAATIAWVLSESVYLVRMLRSTVFDQTSYFLYYFAFGWGFPTFLIVCLYIPSIQFTIGARDTRCWSHHRQSLYMLVIYLPLTVILALNVGTISYVVYVMNRKRNLRVESNLETGYIKKAVKKVFLWMPLLSVVYILEFYIPKGNVGFGYFISVVYPLQGFIVCLVYVIFNTEVRNAFKNTWTRWKTGNFSYATGDNTRNNAKRQYRIDDESHSQNSPFFVHDENSQESMQCNPAIDKHLIKERSETPRSRSGKVAPEPSAPIRINVGSSTSFRSDNNDTIYLYRANNSNGTVAVKAAWNEALTYEQDEPISGEETADDGDMLPQKPDLSFEPGDMVSGKGNISQNVSEFADPNTPQCQNVVPEESFSNASEQESEIELQPADSAPPQFRMCPSLQNVSEFADLNTPQCQNVVPEDSFNNTSKQESEIELLAADSAPPQLKQGKETSRELKRKESANSVPNLEYVSNEDSAETASKEEDNLANVEPPAGETESDDKIQEDGPEPQSNRLYKIDKPKNTSQKRWQAARMAAMASGHSPALLVSPPAQQVLEQAKEGSEQRSKWIVELLSGLASQNKNSEA